MTAKLQLPPGFYDNGTDYGTAGRWRTGNLVRWRENSIVPIGGWRRALNTVTKEAVTRLWTGGDEAARSALALNVEAAGETNLFIGTNRGIFRLTNTNEASSVTPTGFTLQGKDATEDIGYGSSAYGISDYGTQRQAGQGAPVPVFSWGFSAWGFWPVACARAVGGLPLYVKRPTDTTFVPIANSPLGVNDAIVTHERFILTAGAPDDDMLLQWSDREDFETWAPTIENSAGFYRPSGSGRLLRLLKIGTEHLAVGEGDAFRIVYEGPPYIYGVYRVGEKCGIVGANAIASTMSFAVWMGEGQFWMYDGAAVSQLPCEVIDYLRNDIDVAQQSKTSAFNNSQHSEVWWLYQSVNSPTREVDSYVVFNYKLNVWYYGRIRRTVGVDVGPLRNVMMVSHDGTVFDHEIEGTAHGTDVPWIASGPLETQQGHRLTKMHYVLPDVQPSNSSVQMTLSVRDYPNVAFRYSRTMALSNPTPTTGIMGREICMTLEGTREQNAPKSWSIGDMRVALNAGPVR